MAKRAGLSSFGVDERQDAGRVERFYGDPASASAGGGGARLDVGGGAQILPVPFHRFQLSVPRDEQYRFRFSQKRLAFNVFIRAVEIKRAVFPSAYRDRPHALSRAA